VVYKTDIILKSPTVGLQTVVAVVYRLNIISKSSTMGLRTSVGVVLLPKSHFFNSGAQTIQIMLAELGIIIALINIYALFYKCVSTLADNSPLNHPNSALHSKNVL